VDQVEAEGAEAGAAGRWNFLRVPKIAGATRVVKKEWINSLFLARTAASRYSVSTMDEQEFQKRCDAAFEALLRRLQEAGDAHGFEVEGGSGKLEVLFEDADETRFVISPNTPVRQIWISALTTSFKLSWSDAAGTFVLDKTGETLMQLMGRILTEQLGSPVTV
jgi:iron donor protein CyaY